MQEVTEGLDATGCVINAQRLGQGETEACHTCKAAGPVALLRLRRRHELQQHMSTAVVHLGVWTPYRTRLQPPVFASLLVGFSGLATLIHLQAASEIDMNPVSRDAHV